MADQTQPPHTPGSAVTPQGKPTNPAILVVRGGAIGDFILTLPVLQALRQHLPKAEVHVLGYPRIAELARAGGHANEVHSVESREMAMLFARGVDPSPRLASFFQRFAIIISYLYDPDGIFAANVGKCTKAQFHQGPHRPDGDGARHAVDLLLEPLERLAIFDPDPVPSLPLVPLGNAPLISPTVTQLSSPSDFWLAVHPGSGGTIKNWPVARWADLLGKLSRECPWHLLLIGGEAENETLKVLATCWPSDRLEVCANRPLPELARRMAGCDFFLGHDSGITHLAAAVGLPGLALWGPTNPRVWRPRSERFDLLEAGGHLESLDVAEVLDGVRNCVARHVRR